MPGRPEKTALPEQASRLREARALRGFADAAAAATFFGWNYMTYSQHERGERGLSRAAGRYASALRVGEGWLLTGDGPRESGRIPVHGRIGAGAVVTMKDDDEEIADGAWFEPPDPGECWAFVVEGDSMRPRFYAGEVVVFARKPSPEAELLGQYCLVQMLESGDRLVKVLRRGSGGRWRLESHNADPIEDVNLLAAYRWEATFRPRNGRPTLVAETPRAPRRR